MTKCQAMYWDDLFRQHAGPHFSNYQLIWHKKGEHYFISPTLKPQTEVQEINPYISSLWVPNLKMPLAFICDNGTIIKNDGILLSMKLATHQLTIGYYTGSKEPEKFTGVRLKHKESQSKPQQEAFEKKIIKNFFEHRFTDDTKKGCLYEFISLPQTPQEWEEIKKSTNIFLKNPSCHALFKVLGFDLNLNNVSITLEKEDISSNSKNKKQQKKINVELKQKKPVNVNKYNKFVTNKNWKSLEISP